jgi:hypothetical protein
MKIDALTKGGASTAMSISEIARETRVRKCDFGKG